uniref:C-type lectin domain-containing protein n=1 Tax=Scleropages formosus TaxID=113540 RepID=A0A8C9SVS1_SCLFO
KPLSAYFLTLSTVLALHRTSGLTIGPTVPTASSNPEPPPTQNPCPSGYTSWYNNCYKLVEEHKTWEEAQLACEQEKGNLASIDYSYDQAFVAGAVLQGMSDAWIGLRRKGSDSYSWSDGWPVFFTNWGPGEPTNEKGEGCVTCFIQIMNDLHHHGQGH